MTSGSKPIGTNPSGTQEGSLMHGFAGLISFALSSLLYALSVSVPGLRPNTGWKQHWAQERQPKRSLGAFSLQMLSWHWARSP